VAQRRQTTSPKKRSRSPQQTVESLRQSLTRERELRKQGLAREKEAFEQQTATAEILKVISSSPTDLQPVFDTILEKAMHLCEAHLGFLGMYDGQKYENVAQRGSSAEFAKWIARGPFVPDPRMAIACALLERKPVQHDDLKDSPGYREGVEGIVKTAELGGARTILAVPMLKEGRAVGGIIIYRPEVRPFTQKQIDLVSTFADQAVIAIENARLFNETKEALEQLTTTADVLRVIAGSPADVKPVLETVAMRAAKICDASDARIWLVEGDAIRHAAGFGDIPITVEAGDARPIERGLLPGRAILDRAPVHVEDIQAVSSEDLPLSRDIARHSGWRTALSVPLLREAHALGAITLRRMEVRPFTEKQIALLKTFADQAAIAIENVRLFNETKEALEQQTATAEILKVISGSPTDIAPVFAAILKSATELCGAHFGNLNLRDGEGFRTVAQRGANAEFAKHVSGRGAFKPMGAFARMTVERQAVQVPDLREGDAYRAGQVEAVKWIQMSGARSFLAVPLLKEGQVIGGIAIYRPEVRPFTDQQIALVSTFADQAVIAIENVRLFNETKEALERQTATSEILRVMSSSPADLQPVFDTIARNFIALCGAAFGGVYTYDGRLVHLAGVAGLRSEQERRTHRAKYPVGVDDSSVVSARTIRARAPVHVEDALADAHYDPERAKRLGVRRLLGVPMLREGEPLGALVAGWSEAGPTPKQHEELLRTFADQAAIAIENVRLFNETKEALEQQKATAEVLGVISGSIADTQPVFHKILDSCERLFEGHLVGITVVRPDGMLDRAAYRGPHEEEIRSMFPMALSRDSASGNAILDAQVVHYPDIEAPGVPAGAVQRFRMAGMRAIICAPMLFEGRGVGAIWVGRKFTAAFTDKQIALLRTFADQAAIAIQNAKLFREIQEKSAQLEVASHHKSQFLASMSHELRTPLNAILGFNEMILDDVYGPVSAEVKSALEEMQGSGKHLLRLINNVLDLAKIEAGRMELALADYSVQDTVESVRSTLRPLAESEGLELLATVPQNLPLAYGDPGRVTQCLMNLAGNSLKFTKAGKVQISVALDNGRLRYSVADTGIGIPPDKIGSLFTEFKQTDATIASEYGGTGLGLSITKKFIEMHGGRIWVESEPGTGSTFTFEVPLRAGERKAA